MTRRKARDDTEAVACRVLAEPGATREKAYVIPTKEGVYSLANLFKSKLSYNETNNNRFLPYGRNDIVICFALIKNRL